MAKLKYNVVMHGASGVVGDLLEFRQRNGKTIIAKIRARTKKVTAAQQLVRDTFRRAAAWAKSALKDPSIKAVYELRASGDIAASNLAMKDFFTPPVVTVVNTDAYNGAIGSSIIVTATDDTKVVSVAVQIFDNSRNLLEEGAAIQQGDEDDWLYTATTLNNSPAGGTVVVEARDLPGNKTTKEILL